jgi:hypothetical protein
VFNFIVHLPSENIISVLSSFLLAPSLSLSLFSVLVSTLSELGEGKFWGVEHDIVAVTGKGMHGQAGIP